jgi:anti-sigma B factor antagonist
MALVITVHGSRVDLSGAVDLETAPSLRAELVELINTAGAGAELRVDLGEVTLLDSNGLSVLLAAHRLALTRDARLELAAVPQHVQRTLNVTGLDEVLHIGA